MKLAKPCFDLGLMTTRPGETIAFWRDEIGATFDHVLPIAPGHDQHRFDLLGSVLKINAVRELPDGTPSGYREVIVARPGLTAPRALQDPDGNRVTLAPPGYSGITQLGLRVGVRDPEAHGIFYRNALELPAITENSFRVGESVILIEHDDQAHGDVSLGAPGWRYVTLQILDARTEYTRFLAAGGFEGLPLQRLGDVAIFVMVRDPDGNWIELSQRASLTGPLD